MAKAKNKVAVEIAKINAKQAVIVALITAIVSIAGLLLTSDVFGGNSKQQKPHFEGVWDYEVKFNPFHRLKEDYVSHGHLIFDWNESKQGYDLYHSYMIEKNWSDEDVVTGFSEGFLNV